MSLLNTFSTDEVIIQKMKLLEKQLNIMVDPAHETQLFSSNGWLLNLKKTV